MKNRDNKISRYFKRFYKSIESQPLKNIPVKPIEVVIEQPTEEELFQKKKQDALLQKIDRIANLTGMEEERASIIRANRDTFNLTPARIAHHIMYHEKLN